MSYHIPKKILDRMRYLEKIDNKYKTEGPYSKVLWQIPEETGKFIEFMATTAPEGDYVEIGTGGGYSALWIALACRKFTNRKLTTFEIDKEKAKLAKETIKISETNDFIELIIGDALDYLDEFKNISFCFLDTEDKSIYQECYERVISNMVKGGIFIADNAISHKFSLQSMLDNVFKDKRVRSIINQVGKGVLTCRKK